MTGAQLGSGMACLLNRHLVESQGIARDLGKSHFIPGIDLDQKAQDGFYSAIEIL